MNRRITLRDIGTAADRAAALAVERGPGQEQLVPSVEESLDVAAAWPQAKARSWTVNDGDEVVGFVMLSDGVEREVYEADPHMVAPYFLMRLLIDRRRQRRGYGTATLDTIVDYLRTRPEADSLYTSAGQRDGTPQPFYEGYGFVPTERFVDGERVLRLDLREKGLPAT